MIAQDAWRKVAKAACQAKKMRSWLWFERETEVCLILWKTALCIELCCFQQNPVSILWLPQNRVPMFCNSQVLLTSLRSPQLEKWVSEVVVVRRGSHIDDDGEVLKNKPIALKKHPFFRDYFSAGKCRRFHFFFQKIQKISERFQTFSPWPSSSIPCIEMKWRWTGRDNLILDNLVQSSW